LEIIPFVKLHVFKGTMVFGVMENGLIYRSKKQHLTAAQTLRRCTGLGCATIWFRGYAPPNRRLAAER
jgi:hypothetical protein